MNWFDRIRIGRAAMRYARRLPPLLAEMYGESEIYTPAQIKAGMAQARLGGRFAALGYASALSEADYLANVDSYPLVLPYDVARALFDDGRPWEPAWEEIGQTPGVGALASGPK